MTKLNALFDKFLHNIQPDERMVKHAHNAHEPVRDFLENDEAFKYYVEDSFLYGSYKRNTAVGDIKDVDIVVVTNFDTGSEEYTPQKVLRKLKSALAKHYGDPKNQEYQRRSIRINDPLPDNQDVEMTLDIIPAVAINGGDQPLLVPDRELKEWIWSNPKGHLEYTKNLNKPENSEERFVPLVKIMKWWWKYQCSVRQPKEDRPKPKGFWIEVLTGENFDSSQHFYADHFITVLSNVSVKYSGVAYAPDLADPSLPGEYIKTDITKEQFGIFMKAVSESLELAKQARSHPNDFESSKIWQKIFGPEKFPLSSQIVGLVKDNTMPLGDTSHAIAPPWPELRGSRHTVAIRATLCDPATKKFIRTLRNDGEILGPNELIKFFAETNIKADYEVRWQVVNTGDHARSDGALRGTEFFRGREFIGTGSSKSTPTADQKINFETTKYSGKHWIQCFVIQDGRYVAKSDKFLVNIDNPAFTK